MSSSLVLGGYTTLIADDFAPFQDFLRSKLQQNGFKIFIEASDGQEAVVKAAERQPDLILLDVAMPKLNGLEAAIQIRRVAPKARILFVSQNTDPDVARSALQNGAAGFVAKSDVHRELMPAINAALTGGRFVSSRLHSDVFS